MDISIFDNYNVSVDDLKEFLYDCCEEFSDTYKYFVEDDLNADHIYPDFIETEIYVDSREETINFDSKVNVYGYCKYYIDDNEDSFIDVILQNIPLWKAVFLMNQSVLTRDYPDSKYKISNHEFNEFLNTYFGKK